MIFLKALLSIFLFTHLVGCSKDSHLYSSSLRPPYVYEDPRSGEPVNTRQVDQLGNLNPKKPTNPLAQVRPSLFINPKFQINMRTKEVSFRFIKRDSPLDGQLIDQDIELKGRLDNDYYGWIDDTNPTDGRSRAVAMISCQRARNKNESPCGSVLISLRYINNLGRETETQFHIDPKIEEIDRKREKERLEREQKSQADNNTAPVNEAPIYIDLDDKDLHSFHEEDIEPDDVGLVITERTPPEWAVKLRPRSRLNPYAPTTPTQPSSSQVQQPNLLVTPNSDRKQPKSFPPTLTPPNQPQFPSHNTPSEEPDKLYFDVPGDYNSALSTAGFRLNLLTGGISIRYPENGAIRNASQLPLSGDGFSSADQSGQFSYGSGFLIDFIQSKAKYFSQANPECSEFKINHISVKNGGPFKPHKTHRNGLDVDISYFNKDPKASWEPMLINQKNRLTMNPNFDYGCFLKYLKFLDDQKLTNTGDDRVEGRDIVDLLFVHSAIQKEVCTYTKKNNLMEEYGEALNLLYPERGHAKHFHLRVLCSPGHYNPKNPYENCRTHSLDRKPPFRKRGCR